MLRPTLVIVTSLLAFVMTDSLHGQKGKPGGGGGGSNTLTPVTLEFRCPMTADCLAVDGIEGDSMGTYRGTTPNGAATTPEGTESNLGSYFTEQGLLVFALKPGRGRFVSFDFSQPLGAAPCAAKCRKNFTAATSDESLPGSRTYPLDAAGADLPNGFNSIPVGGSAPAKLFLNFADPDGRDILWTVRFNPYQYPGTSLLTVTRTSSTTWTVEADANDVAQLESATTSGKQVKLNEGFYRMPYKAVITR
jgi:hypothetical protein